MLNVSIKLDGLDAFRKKIAPERIQKAIVRALDKTAQQGKVAAQREIRAAYNLKLKDVSEQLRVNIHPSQLEATIEAKGKRLLLILFGAKQQGVKYSLKGKSVQKTSKIRGKNTGGVSLEIKHGDRKIIKGAFITAVGKGRHIGVFQRVGNKRLPIRERVGIGVAHMFGSRRVIDNAKKRISEQWPKNIAHELNQAMKV